jgi:hypothetical protein
LIDLNETHESHLLSSNESNMYNSEETHCLTSNDFYLEKKKDENHSISVTDSCIVNYPNSEVNEKNKNILNEDTLSGALNEKNLCISNNNYRKETKYDKGDQLGCKKKPESSDPISKSFKSSLRGVYFHFLKQVDK